MMNTEGNGHDRDSSNMNPQVFSRVEAGREVDGRGDKPDPSFDEPSILHDAIREEILPRVAVFCVGNKLMLDEGIGPAVYDELVAAYDIPDVVTLFDVGCMGLDMLPHVRDYDYLITVDAVDGTGEIPGTVFEFEPSDMARRSKAMQSLHDLKLIDLFDSAALIGYEAQGRCFGMQVENMNPAELTIGLTPVVYDALPLLVDTVLADLVRFGVDVRVKATGQTVGPETHHAMMPEPAIGRIL